jgi:lipopolysaccharide heptosyltransferase III
MFSQSPLAPDDAPVVVRFPALGDAVLLTPLLQALHMRYGRKVNLLTSGAWTPLLLGSHPSVGQLCTVRSRRAPYWLMPSQWRAVHWLRSQRGPIYLCEADPYALRLVSRALASTRMLKAWEHWPGDGIHWVDWWLQVAQLDPPDIPGPHADPSIFRAQPCLPLLPAWQEEARAWLLAQGLSGSAVVLLQPGHKKTHKRGRIGTAQHNKHWPPERWAGVIRGILDSCADLVVLVCGSPREHGLAQEIVDAAQAGKRVRNVARDLPLHRLVALSAVAHSMVSVDTGPAHVAAAMDCPSVVLFGHFGWRRWKPRAPDSDVIALGSEWPDPQRSLMDISVDEVLVAWRSLKRRGVSEGASNVAAPATSVDLVTQDG